MSSHPYIYVVIDRGIVWAAFTNKYELVEFLKGKTLWGRQVYRVSPYDQKVVDITDAFNQ